MIVLFNIIGFAFIGGAGYLIWSWSRWLHSTPRIMSREARKLAREAAKAARSGQYAERDRLDDARDAILTGLAGYERGRRWQFKGTAHDDYHSIYLKEGDS